MKVLIMSGYGINCEAESAHAFELAGASAEIVHINDLIDKRKNLKDFDIIMFPGGFSYGDDTGSGNAFANKVRNNLLNDLLEFINDKKLIFGVCNGFQVMSNLGLFPIPGMEYGQRTHALTANSVNRYECRWVNLKALNNCVFTKNIDLTRMPVAHGEGRFYCPDETLKQLQENGQVILGYAKINGEEANGNYPFNPNGSLKDIAAICDKTGRVMGMMPHPERALYSYSDPEKAYNTEYIENNLQIFRNAVNYFKNE